MTLKYLGSDLRISSHDETHSYSDLTQFMKRNPRTYQRDTRDCRARETMPLPWEKTHDCRSPSWQTALFKAPLVTRVCYLSVASRAVETPCFRPETEARVMPRYVFLRGAIYTAYEEKSEALIYVFASRDPRRSSSKSWSHDTRAPVIHDYDILRTLCEIEATP